MSHPHETPVPGPAADFALALSAHLPVLETPRLRLRAPRLEDIEPWVEILCGPAGPHLGGPFTRDEAFAEFACACGTWLLRGHGLWTVDSRDDETLGFVLIGFEAGDLEPELGYLFLPSAEGHGYATEAAQAARGHARALRLPSLVSYIDPANTRSRQLARRLGATCEGDNAGSNVWRHWGAQHSGGQA
ncbi:MAG: GNAT family N-acetyltransferase [Rhodobacteraceae bacterium]|jgi:RimJ/RimL family protein N-acetyltransferase|nr:GNAT family N-acetyltransferase [Paracoccaceae bacterium]